MTAPGLEIRNPKFIDHMVGHRSDSGIDGFLGATVVEMEAGRLVRGQPPRSSRSITYGQLAVVLAGLWRRSSP